MRSGCNGRSRAQRVSVRATLGQFVEWCRRSGGTGSVCQVLTHLAATGKAKKSDKGKQEPTPTPSKKSHFRFASRFAKPLYSPNTTGI